MTRDESTAAPADTDIWLDVRRHLVARRAELTQQAAEHYPSTPRVNDTLLLTTDTWRPLTALALSEVQLHLEPDRPFSGLLGTEDVSSAVRPRRADGTRYHTYSAVMGELAAPTVFDDRPTYRLLDTSVEDRPSLVFGRGTYFDGINTGEAAAHEFAAATLGVTGDLPLRRAIGNPCDPRRRPTNVAVSTLTIRADRDAGSATFFLHWRDPAKVGHAGGMYHVVPVGVFQPSGDGYHNEHNDFDLWRCTIRELAEELLGHPEHHGCDHTPIDYDNWPFARQLTSRLDGGVRAYYLGMGVDPLTFATDILTAVIVDAALFDETFGDVVGINTEGRVLEALDFTEDNIDRFVRTEPTQPAGAATLAQVWKHRDHLLG